MLLACTAQHSLLSCSEVCSSARKGSVACIATASQQAPRRTCDAVAVHIHHMPTLCLLPCFQANNAIVKEYGEPRKEAKLYNHVDLVQVGEAVTGSSSSQGCRTVTGSG
jgi:hypothetical protein